MEAEKNMKKIVSIQTILPRKKKNTNDDNRLLITVNVVGSSGPLRLVVNEDDKVSTVMDSSLKLYARSGRLPILGSDFKDFMLYALTEGSALNPSEEIGSFRGRNFVLCQKKNNLIVKDCESADILVDAANGGRLETVVVVV
ncbi:hypothetical protein Lser_V15G19858 [Lactuca serriola]